VTVVLRSHRDVTPDFLTEVLQAAGWIVDASVVDAHVDVTTAGPGLTGVCARYELRFDREAGGARLVGGADGVRPRVPGRAA
jgi:hypothetical protein